MSEAAFSAAAIGVVAAAAAVMLRQSSPHMALMLALVASAVILSRILGFIDTLIDYAKVLITLSHITEDIISPVLKSAAVVITGHFCSSLCRDAGQGAIASMVEMAVNVCCVCLALPLVKLTVDTLGELL